MSGMDGVNVIPRGTSVNACRSFSRWLPANGSAPIRRARSTEVLRFRSYLPLFSLEAFAGNLRERMQVEPEGWVEAWSQSRLSKDMFVTHTKGSEPAIPDDCVCAIRGHLIGSPDGKVLLVQQLVSDFRTEVIDGVFFVNSITPRNVPLLNTPSRIAPGLGDICCICQTGHYTECQQTPRSI